MNEAFPRTLERKMLKGRTVLFLVTEDWYFLLHRLPLANAVQNAGAKVIVATSPGREAERIRNEGFSYYPLKMRRKSKSIFNEIYALLDILRLYRNNKPDIVHQVALKPILYGSLIARIAGIPAVINAVTGLGHAFLGTTPKHRRLQLVAETAYKVILRNRNLRCLFENPDDLNHFISKKLIGKEKAVLVSGTGVDPDKFSVLPPPDGKVIVTMAARMLWDKGVATMVDVARILKHKDLNCEVVLCGVPDASNPSAVPVEQLLKWQNDGLIKWIGYQSNMPKVYSESHIICLPSYREGLPVSLVEGAACGRPIVATDVPGCREIVKHGWNGFLAPLGDSVTFAERVAELVVSSSLRTEMGTRGRELILDKYTLDIVNRQILDVYKEICAVLP